MRLRARYAMVLEGKRWKDALTGTYQARSGPRYAQPRLQNMVFFQSPAAGWIKRNARWMQYSLY